MNVNAIGWIGALLVLFAYYLLSFNYVTSKDIEYNVCNLFGGMCLAFRDRKSVV